MGYTMRARQRKGAQKNSGACCATISPMPNPNAGNVCLFAQWITENSFANTIEQTHPLPNPPLEGGGISLLLATPQPTALPDSLKERDLLVFGKPPSQRGVSAAGGRGFAHRNISKGEAMKRPGERKDF
jgi:hypothetical protein